MSRKSLKQTLIDRDGISEEDARVQIEQAQSDLYDIMDSGGSLDEAQELIEDVFGLEPDYLEDLLM